MCASVKFNYILLFDNIWLYFTFQYKCYVIVLQ